MISRRFFLKLSAIAGVGLVLPYEWLANAPRVRAFSQSDQLTKFSQKLRMIGSDIPLATKDTANPGWWQPGVDHYTIDIGQFTDKLHPTCQMKHTCGDTARVSTRPIHTGPNISVGSLLPSEENPSRSHSATIYQPTIISFQSICPSWAPMAP